MHINKCVAGERGQQERTVTLRGFTGRDREGRCVRYLSCTGLYLRITSSTQEDVKHMNTFLQLSTTFALCTYLIIIIIIIIIIIFNIQCIYSNFLYFNVFQCLLLYAHIAHAKQHLIFNYI